MSSRIRLCISGVSLTTLLVSGCARQALAPHSAPVQNQQDHYARTDLDELLEFGSMLAEMSESERADFCREMTRREADPTATGDGLTLHQMIGRLHSDACGDSKTLMARVDSIPPDRLPDLRTRRLVAMQADLLRRSLPAATKSRHPKHRSKGRRTIEENSRPVTKTPITVRGPATTPTPKPVTAAKENEDQLHRQKLEAIREMEKKLDAADVSR